MCELELGYLVYEHVPGDTDYPYVLLGEQFSQNVRTNKDKRNKDVQTTIHVWHKSISANFLGCQTLVRFLALRRIKPHAPPLVRVPVNSFEFHTCVRTPQADYLSR